MKLNNDIIVIGTGCSPTTANAWLESLQAACDKYEINTPRRVAAFLANVAVESGHLTVFQENLNYSAQGLANTWPFRYSQNPHGDPKVPNEQAMGLQHNAKAIANNVYADRLGNSHEVTGDGWAYRGAGPIQLTGKDAHVAFAMDAHLDFTVTDWHELFGQPEVGAMSAAWFFGKYKAGCLAAADEGDMARTVQLVNGQSPVASNGGPERLKRYGDCLAACEKVSEAATVAGTKPTTVAAKKPLPTAKP